MIDKLKNLLENSYSPYSKFRVSAVVITSDGSSFNGVNVENASYGVCCCAERVAIFTAVSNGYKKGDFKELHIMCDTSDFGMPCMICRQVFTEFFDNTTKIYVYNNKGEKKLFFLNDICPYPFNGDIL